MFNSALNVFELDISNQEKAKRILVKSQVFGGMGSWNDSPGYKAYRLGIKRNTKRLQRSCLNSNWFYRKRSVWPKEIKKDRS